MWRKDDKEVIREGRRGDRKEGKGNEGETK